LEGTRRSSDCRCVCVLRGVPKGWSVETGADIGGAVDGSRPIRFAISSWRCAGPLLPYAIESLEGMMKVSVPAVVVPEAAADNRRSVCDGGSMGAGSKWLCVLALT
jgi:hypothetical protein